MIHVTLDTHNFSAVSKALFDFYLTFEDMTAIDGLNKNRR
jgi:hypothetical protein